jgi:predicted transcriptional regulator
MTEIMTTRVVTAHLPQELAEERRRETLAALEEVDSGRIVEHAEVEAWAAGLGRPKKSRASSKHAD